MLSALRTKIDQIGMSAIIKLFGMTLDLLANKFAQVHLLVLNIGLEEKMGMWLSEISTRTQNYWSQPMKFNHYTVLAMISMLLTITGLSWLSYTIVDQQRQIEQLQEQLQHEQMKYKMLYRDPIVREVIESGG